jgi:hypothetical protein
MTLERDLRALAGGFPETPDLAGRVLTAAQGAALRRRRRRRIAVIALALFLLVPATALGVSPDLRHRVLETFGLRNVTVERVTHLPAVSPATAQRLELGSPITLRRARAAVGAHVSPPSLLGRPDGIFEDPLQSGVDVTFVYLPGTTAARIGVRKRVLVSVVRGAIDKRFLGKMTGQATSVRPYLLDGESALLITGAPHLLILIRRGDGMNQTYTRQAGATLLWQRGPLLVRVEGDLPRARLEAVARSLSTG